MNIERCNLTIISYHFTSQLKSLLIIRHHHQLKKLIECDIDLVNYQMLEFIRAQFQLMIVILMSIWFQIDPIRMQAIVQLCLLRTLRRMVRFSRVDGGVSRNDFLMQLISDLTLVKIERPSSVETAGLGAALMAGIEIGKESS